MSKIFVCYRRFESIDIVGRIGDRLRKHFGDDSIFIDIDNTPVGVDYRSYISESVSKSSIVLVVIGQSWTDLLKSKNKFEKDGVHDVVRYEIETALAFEKIIIPLLIQGASMPDYRTLPRSIAKIGYINAMPIRSDPDFHRDLDKLTEIVDGFLLKELSNTDDRVDALFEGDLRSTVDSKIQTEEESARAKGWRILEQARVDDEIIKGNITAKVRGGFSVEVCGIRAFLPLSLSDIHSEDTTNYLDGKELEFKVIKVDQRRNNVVVSRRAAVESEQGTKRESLVENLYEGKEVTGIVKYISDYGALLDLGGIDGLLHITDMSWKRVKHPSEVVEVGSELNVKVLKYDRKRNRVSLGLKQLGDDPWVDLTRRYPEGSRLFGKVTNVSDYGCFVEIVESIEGLVHLSDMEWSNHNVNPYKVVSRGDEVEVMILTIDEELRRISLGIKQCKPNPFEDFSEAYKRNDRVKGSIKSITDFGIFIGLDGGIDGLIQLSDLSWDESGEEAVEKYSKGEQIEAVVLAVDVERERISLGVKQLINDRTDKSPGG